MNQVQILDKAFSILLHGNSLGKSMNPFLLPPVLGRLEDRLSSLAFIRHCCRRIKTELKT